MQYSQHVPNIHIYTQIYNIYSDTCMHSKYTVKHKHTYIHIIYTYSHSHMFTVHLHSHVYKSTNTFSELF